MPRFFKHVTPDERVCHSGLNPGEYGLSGTQDRDGDYRHAEFSIEMGRPDDYPSRYDSTFFWHEDFPSFRDRRETTIAWVNAERIDNNCAVVPQKSINKIKKKVEGFDPEVTDSDIAEFWEEVELCDPEECPDVALEKTLEMNPEFDNKEDLLQALNSDSPHAAFLNRTEIFCEGEIGEEDLVCSDTHPELYPA